MIGHRKRAEIAASRPTTKVTNSRNNFVRYQLLKVFDPLTRLGERASQKGPSARGDTGATTRGRGRAPPPSVAAGFALRRGAFRRIDGVFSATAPGNLTASHVRTSGRGRQGQGTLDKYSDCSAGLGGEKPPPRLVSTSFLCIYYYPFVMLMVISFIRVLHLRNVDGKKVKL